MYIETDSDLLIFTGSDVEENAKAPIRNIGAFQFITNLWAAAAL